MTSHAFNEAERRAVYRAIAERRDMRSFVPDAAVAEDVLARLLQAAHAAPSVGLMQPWRFIRITDAGLRTRIHAIVADERPRTAEALGPRADEFLALKVEGILECAELLVVALCDGRQAHVFGRRTLPQMDLASVSCAIQKPVAGRARRRPRDGLGVDLRPRAPAAAGDRPLDVRPSACGVRRGERLDRDSTGIGWPSW